VEMRCNAMGGGGAPTTLEAMYDAVAAMARGCHIRKASISAYHPRLSNTQSTTAP